MTELVTLVNVSKNYALPSGFCPALKNVSLHVNQGECIAVVGKSGSGKTTLINLLPGIDAPTSGEVHVAGTAIHPLSQEELAVWRGRNVGVVFQFFQLLPTLTILENVMLPMDFCRYLHGAARTQRARELLERVGIVEQADKYPAELSGGQQQRAAIARSVANDPPIVVADEPTGNLDSGTSDQVMSFFSALSQSGKTVLIVTHERDLGRFFTRTIMLNDGAVVADSPV
jgi:putative ABC transport system ATP-binding protein